MASQSTVRIRSHFTSRANFRSLEICLAKNSARLEGRSCVRGDWGGSPQSARRGCLSLRTADCSQCRAARFAKALLGTVRRKAIAETDSLLARVTVKHDFA